LDLPAHEKSAILGLLDFIHTLKALLFTLHAQMNNTSTSECIKCSTYGRLAFSFDGRWFSMLYQISCATLQSTQ